MDNKKKILVEELHVGMIFTEPIYIDKENILVNANEPIKESDIKKLMMWGVTEIETSGDRVNKSKKSPDNNDEEHIIEKYNELLKKRKKLIEIYQKVRAAVNNAYTSIKQGNSFLINDISQSVEEIIQILKENNNVFLFLYGLDEGKNYLATHSVNVTFYSIIIGQALNYPNDKLKDLGIGTLLIDAGMVKVPNYIIHKQSNLTQQEYNQIKTHPLLGYTSINNLDNSNERIANISLQHHEQFDGKGYPRGLKGNEIDEFARIAAIADSYEAQISKRSYRKKVYFYHAMRNLLSSGVNKFDPVILRVFLSRMSVYPIGSLVEINDSRIGIIIGSIPEKPLRPIIKIIFDEKKKPLQKMVIVNLLNDSSKYIVRALDEAEVGINIFDVL